MGSSPRRCKPSFTMMMSRWVVTCPAQLGHFVSHLGLASAQIASDLFYRSLAREHVTEVNEIHLGPANPGIHVRPIEGGIFARELTTRVMHQGFIPEPFSGLG